MNYKTISTYKSTLRNLPEINSRMGDEKVLDVLQNYIDKESEISSKKGSTGGRIKVLVSGVRKYLSYIYRNQGSKGTRIAKRIGRQLIIPTKIRKHKTALEGEDGWKDLDKKILTKDEIRLLINACKRERDKLIIRMLYETACRIEEFVNIEWKDISWDKNTIKLRAEITKKQKPRVVKFSDYTKNKLLSIRKPEGRIINITPLRVWQIIKEVSYKSKINKSPSPHWFRHSFATHNVIKYGKEKMQDYLGHSSVKTTEHYSKYAERMESDIEPEL